MKKGSKGKIIKENETTYIAGEGHHHGSREKENILLFIYFDSTNLYCTFAVCHTLMVGATVKEPKYSEMTHKRKRGISSCPFCSRCQEAQRQILYSK